MSKNKQGDFKRFEAKNRNEWHNWLLKNHLSSQGVWLVYYKKKSEKPTISYDEAVEEALSFGWIDSKVNTLDEKRYMQIFTPRKQGSIWSKLNRSRIKRLIENGNMMPTGLKKVEAAKKDGSWYFLDDIEALKVPLDLKESLEANEIAKNNFKNFNDTIKKQILYWIKIAKRENTRKKRIQKTVELASEGKDPFS